MPRKSNPRSPYPKYFVTPSGRPVSIKTMANALRVIRSNPSADYPGWEWYPVTGWHILNDFRNGLNDRINQRGKLGGAANYNATKG